VVIDNFNVLRAVLSPNEANSKLGIDTYAVLAATITIKYFKPVARWGSKIRQQEPRPALRAFALQPPSKQAKAEFCHAEKVLAYHRI